ncbi:unnamed protein product [Phytomonas sp. EM1]|nr:unnamed protein product [Phytomonas sp. EM1]|eukprot:CCW65594.1 unnamed protein product [Phytomonas sp. isolate EM1]
MRSLPYHVRPGKVTIFAFCFVLLCCGLFTPKSGALQTDILARELFSITEEVPPETSIEFYFELHNGAAMDVRVVDDKNNDLKYWEDGSEGTLRIDAGEMAKTFTVIFDNRASRFSGKLVTFHFREYINRQNKFDISQLDPIEAGVELMSETIDNMFKYQLALRNQQRLHRETIETSNTRVLMWAIFQIVALIIMSFSQIFFLKRFLERKTVI